MEEQGTEDKIRAAAKAVFTQKGFAAARMQEIADHAGINKGLLHYYFKNKEKLFLSVFHDALDNFIPRVNQVLDADLSLEEKISGFVEAYLEMLIKNPHLPAFVLGEMNQHPEEFARSILSRKELPNPMKLMMQLQMEADAGRIRPVSPLHLWMNIVSMCVLPFAARPMFQAIMGVNDAQYWDFMRSRKKEVTDFILHAIRNENN
jgi:TetR/AcrR family transcriptional regulator